MTMQLPNDTADARAAAVLRSWLGEFGEHAMLHVQGDRVLVGRVRGWRTEAELPGRVRRSDLGDGQVAVELEADGILIPLAVKDADVAAEFMLPLGIVAPGTEEPVVNVLPDGSREEVGRLLDGRLAVYRGHGRLFARRRCEFAAERPSRAPAGPAAHTGHVRPTARGAGRPRARRAVSRVAAGSGGDPDLGDDEPPGEHAGLTRRVLVVVAVAALLWRQASRRRSAS
jgi:hypothetical protein